jgi:glycerol-3-phosphate O-acyltransferase
MDCKTKENTKKQHVTAGMCMSEISSLMAQVMESINAVALVKCTTLQVFAIEAIKKHGGLTTEDLTNVVECVMGDLEFANMYVTVKDTITRRIPLS